MESPARFDPLALRWIVRGNWKLALLPIVAVVCGAWVYLMLVEPQYESNITVAFEQPQVPSALEPLVNADRARETDVTRAAKVAELSNRLQSLDFLKLVAAKMSLDPAKGDSLKPGVGSPSTSALQPGELAARQVAAGIRSRIHVAPVGKALIQITARSTDPVLARNLAAAIADVLVEEMLREKVQQSRAQGEFSSEQIVIVERKLRESEGALRAFEESMVGKNLSDNPVTQSNLETARAVLRGADDEIEVIRVRIITARREWQDRPTGSAETWNLRNPRAAELESRLRNLEISHALGSLQATPDPKEIGALKDKIGSARQALYEEYLAQAEQLHGDLALDVRELAAGLELDRSEMRSLRAKRELVAKNISALARNLQSSPREQLELNRLRSDVEANRNLLSILRREATSSSMSEAFATRELGTRLDIVERPELPLSPTWPDRRRILVAAFVIGPLLSVGLIFAIERFRFTLNKIEQAEHAIGANVIGVVPRIEGLPSPGSFLQRYWVSISIAMLILITLASYVVHSVAGSGSGAPPHAGFPVR